MAHNPGFRSAGMGRNAANGLAARFGRDFSNFTGPSPQNILSRIVNGSSRPYAVAMAENFGNLSAHHQSIARPFLGSLSDVVASGSNPVHAAEQVINVSHFAVTKTRTGLGLADTIGGWTSPDPVDAWRDQLR